MDKSIEQRRKTIIAIVTVFVLCVLLAIIVVLGISLIQTYVLSHPALSSETNHEGMYPRNDLTPGDIITSATKEVICVTGYTKTVRDVPLSLKKKVYASYSIPFPQPEGSYELDHFIPLALGGSNDEKNLWPEAALPKPGFHEKDVVEVYLYDRVCNHHYDLKTAQEEVRNDWYKVYERIPDKKNYMYNSVSN